VDDYICTLENIIENSGYREISIFKDGVVL
jgi:hypothetical protein